MNEKIFYNPNRIIAINVDVQKDFCPGGSLAVTDGDHVVAPLNATNRRVREAQGTVIFTGDQHPETTPHFTQWPVHCVEGTEGARLHDSLIVRDDDIIIDKGTGQTDGYSAFEGRARDGRTLEQIVQPKDRERVALLFGGLATDYCVLSSVLDALKVDPQGGELKVYVLRDAIRAVNLQPQDGEQAIERMKNAGAIITSSVEILQQEAIALAQ